VTHASSTRVTRAAAALSYAARAWVFVLVLAGLFVALLLAAPILQPPGYHAFADSRRVLGLANFWNVATNVPFVAVGMAGLAQLRHCGWQAPLLAVVLVLALFPASRRDGAWLFAALGCYAAAKVFEAADRAFLELTAGALSGHSMKHLLAAAGVACLVMLLRRRSVP